MSERGGMHRSRHQQGLAAAALARLRQPARERRPKVAISLVWNMVLLAWFAATGLVPGRAAAQQLAVVSYTSDDGPAHAQVWSAFQDSRGFMWLGTSEGLSRWDGVEFVGFSSSDGLQNLTIRTIQEDGDGNLWLGTDEGVARFDGRSFTTFAGGEGPGEGTVWCSARDRRGRVWFGTHLGGVGMWTGTRFVSFTTDDGLASNAVYGMLADSSDHLWVGHRDGALSRCSIASSQRLSDCRVFSQSEGLGTDHVRSLVEDGRGMVWIGTRGGGVYRWDGDVFLSFASVHGPRLDDVYAMLVDSRDQLVVGTIRNGIAVCDLPGLDSCRFYGMHNGLADDSILGLALDDDQALWVAAANGVSQLWSEDMETYTLAEGLPHHTVYSLLEDGHGGVMAGTMDGLVRIVRPRAGSEPPLVTTWSGDDVLPGHEVWEVRRDRLGRVWVATEKGLCRFVEGRCEQVLTAADGLADTDLITLLPARDGSLWVGTINGASRLRFAADGGKPAVLVLNDEDGLLGSQVYGLGEDRYGHVWLGTEQGLNRWDGESLQTFSTEDGLPVGEIQRIVSDTTGRLWVGTNGGGLVAIEEEDGAVRFGVHGSDRNIPEVVSAVFDIGGGVLWLGTGNGALLYDPDAEDAATAVLDRLDSAAGLAGNEVNAFATDSTGALWIATSGGLTRVDPRRRRRALPPPRARIERVWTAAGQQWRAPFTAPSALQEPGGSWLGDEPPRLEHDFAALRFEYRGMAFRPRKTIFQVWLEGFDQGWSAPSTAAFKEYTNLDPGSYTFHVRTVSEDGAPGEPLALPFLVVPAWWQTGWARAGLLLAIMALVVTGVRFRTAQIRSRAEELERAVAERTGDLRRYARALEEHSRALDQANLRIREADRVKSEFLANISHELRTPLNSIIGFSELLHRRFEGRAESRELSFLSNVSRSGRYLLLLINNLLDLTKIEADRMEVHVETVPLAEVIEDTLEVFQGYARDREVEVRLQLAPEPAEVEVDVAKLNQVLINLLSNAVKFSSPGSCVEVRVEPVAAEESVLGVASYELAVEDSGPGIRAEDCAVIFEPFRQAGGGRAHPGGTGIGLALVKRFVTLLGGRVTFDSVPGQGTVFRVLLPVQHGEHGGEPTPERPRRDAAAESITRPCVLVVEPDRQQFNTLAHALEHGGLLPVRAGDASEMQRMTEGLRPAALVVLWAGSSERDWAVLAGFVTPPRSLPMVLAAGELVPEPLAGDVCLELPVAATDVITMMSGLGVESGATVLLAGGQPPVRDQLQQALVANGYRTLVVGSGAGDPAAASPDLVIADLSGTDPEPVAATCRATSRRVPRMLLLPAHPPRLGAENRSASASELAQEIRDLLARRSGLVPEKRGASTGQPKGTRGAGSSTDPPTGGGCQGT